MNDKCLLFFVRNPERGPVKTRLAEVVGQETARDLYRNFILDMLSGLEKANHPVIICNYPEDALDDIRRVVGEGYTLKPQQGDDLGERMERGIADAFAQGFDQALVIGSDIPDLPVECIDEAFAALQAYDAVIGPALDGGYYLIGFKRESFLPEAFQGINWGTDAALRQTIDVLRDNQRTTYVLPLLTDIDTVEDLKAFFQKHRGTPNCPRTMAYLKQAKLFEAKDEG